MLHEIARAQAKRYFKLEMVHRDDYTQRVFQAIVAQILVAMVESHIDGFPVSDTERIVLNEMLDMGFNVLGMMREKGYME